MGDDIGSGLLSMAVCFDFPSTNVVQLSNRKYVVYGCLRTIHDSLSLDPNRCHYPLITYLSLDSNSCQQAAPPREAFSIKVQ